MTMVAKRTLLALLSLVALLGAGVLTGCEAKDEAKEAYKGPSGNKDGAPGSSMGGGAGNGKAAPAAAGGLKMEAQPGTK